MQYCADLVSSQFAHHSFILLGSFLVIDSLIPTVPAQQERPSLPPELSVVTHLWTENVEDLSVACVLTILNFCFNCFCLATQKKINRWEQLAVRGKVLRLQIFFFLSSVRETSGFLFLCPFCFFYLALFPDHTLRFHFFFFFFYFWLSISHRKITLVYLLFIKPRAAITSQSLFLIHEQNGIKTRLNGMCLPSKLNNLEKITEGYPGVVTSK